MSYQQLIINLLSSDHFEDEIKETDLSTGELISTICHTEILKSNIVIPVNR